MNDDDYRILSLLYEEKSLTKTAQKLFISQPSLSYRIRKIEEEKENIRKFLVGEKEGVEACLKRIEELNVEIFRINSAVKMVNNKITEIGNKKYPKTKFSVGDRTDNEYKILVGKDFIQKLGGIIDVSKENNLD